MDKYIVDRIEEEFVVLEKDEHVFNISKSLFDFDVKEGDVVIKNEDGNFILDEEETKSRTGYIEEITKDLWNN